MNKISKLSVTFSCLCATALLTTISVPIHAQTVFNTFEDFESYPLGDVQENGTPWGGAAPHFGDIVNVDAEGIRGNTPFSNFGDQVLKFDNPWDAGSSPSQTIEQAVYQISDTDLGTDFATPLFLNFDIRSIEGPGGTAAAEVNIGTPRAGRMGFGTNDGTSTLHAVLFGGDSGGGLTTEFVSDPLNMGQWHNITYALDISNDRYLFIEIDGVVYDNNGDGWNASVGRFGGDIEQIHLIQNSNDADKGGIFFDNMTVDAIPQTGVDVSEGQTFIAASSTFFVGQDVNVDGGTLEFSRSFDVANNINLGEDGGNIEVREGQAPEITGHINADGAFTKSGQGNLIVAGTLNAGLVDVDEGTMDVTGSMTGDVAVKSGAGLGGAGSVTGNVNVETGGTLQGTVAITGNVSVVAGGTHAPGFSPGAQAISGNYNNSGILELELGGLAGATGTYAEPVTGDFDQLFVSGLATLDGTTLQVMPWDNFTPEVDDSFITLYATDGIDILDTLNIDASGFGPGYAFTYNVLEGLSVLGETDVSGLELVVTAIPEPSTLILGAGLAGGLLLRRRTT